MGGPKALLAVRWGDGTGELPLAIAHARSMLEGGAERVIVVTTPAVAREIARFAQRGLDIIATCVAAAPESHRRPEGALGVALELLERGETHFTNEHSDDGHANVDEGA